MRKGLPLIMTCLSAFVFIFLTGFQPPYYTFPTEYTRTITNTESLNPSSASVNFRIGLVNFDDCTYEASKSGDIVFRAKITLVKNDGTTTCVINEPIDHKDILTTGIGNVITILEIPATVGEEIRAFISLVAYPKDSPNCYGEVINCNSPLPLCCFDFTCCDCAQWDGTLLEGFWYSGQSTNVIPSQNSYSYYFNMTFVYPPYAPYPNYASNSFDKGCNCCGH